MKAFVNYQVILKYTLNTDKNTSFGRNNTDSFLRLKIYEYIDQLLTKKSIPILIHYSNKHTDPPPLNGLPTCVVCVCLYVSLGDEPIRYIANKRPPKNWRIAKASSMFFTKLATINRGEHRISLGIGCGTWSRKITQHFWVTGLDNIQVKCRLFDWFWLHMDYKTFIDWLSGIVFHQASWVKGEDGWGADLKWIFANRCVRASHCANHAPYCHQATHIGHPSINRHLV